MKLERTEENMPYTMQCNPIPTPLVSYDDYVVAEGEWDMLMLEQQGIKSICFGPDSIGSTGECYEFKTAYGMGTREETFRLNWKYFGLLSAVHRFIEQVAMNYLHEFESARRNKEAVKKYNFVLYKTPWYSWYASKIESRLYKLVLYFKKRKKK